MVHQLDSEHTNATVSRVHRGRVIARIGRGYSYLELQAAGLSLAKAEELHLRLDQRRRSRYDFNVSRLKEIASAIGTVRPVRPPEEAR